MKLLVALALVLTIASAFDLREAETNSSSTVVPAIRKEGRIYNGDTASEGQFTYQVAVVSKFEDLSERWCGGSIIGRQWVLTSAHCVADVRSVIVQIGGLVRTEPEARFKVSKTDFKIHPHWQKETASNDIALIKTPPMPITRTIQLVKLPARTGSDSSYKHKSVIASGWGRTSGGSRYLSDNLRYARMKVISRSYCKALYGKAITEKLICAAANGGASICSGDSGGPLVLESDKVLIGVTTFGGEDGCGNPSVFTRVTKYLDWIFITSSIGY